MFCWKRACRFWSNVPNDLGVRDGRLADCPTAPNCVSSQLDDRRHHIEPLVFGDPPEQAFARLEQLLASRRDTTIIGRQPGYLRVEFRTTLFVDDGEFLIDEQRGVIDIRSASRLGYSDLGKNRNRLEQIRREFAQAPQQGLAPFSYAIIIPAYNEAQELPATLAAVRRAMAVQDIPGECIVVDNNSTDDTAKVAKAAGADRVVHEPVNQISRARNAGAAVSGAEFLVFVDADTRIEAALLTGALRLLRSDRCAGGGAVVHFEGETSAVGRFAIGLWEWISRLTRTAAGSFFFCRREAFEAVGGFDSKLYAAEEVRLSRLIRRWGRTRGLSFEILTDPPVSTSARKLQWYSGPQILGWILFMVLMPFAVRSRWLCGFWYNRPKPRK